MERSSHSYYVRKSINKANYRRTKETNEKFSLFIGLIAM